jgi:hypothetical protein
MHANLWKGKAFCNVFVFYIRERSSERSSFFFKIKPVRHSHREKPFVICSFCITEIIREEFLLLLPPQEIKPIGGSVVASMICRAPKPK